MPVIWRPPITWQVDQLVTEADLNQQVRDNLEFLYAGLTGYILLRDEKAAGTDGGSFTAGAWQTRELNTKVVDVGSYAALSANQITLPAGTYRCRIQCPAYAVNKHQARLYNVTNAAVLLLGSSQRNASASALFVVPSIIAGRFTLATTKVLEVQHRCETTQAGSGLGQSSGFDTEIYTIAEFWKEA